MKRLFLALGLLMVWTATAVAQQNCVDLQEIDGSPRAPCVKKILVTNGTLTCSATNVCTLVTGGGGGGGAPGGLNTQVQWNDGGAFNGTSGLTATATTITIVSGVTETFSRAGLLYTGTVTTDAASVQTQIIQGDRATVASNDEAYITYRLSNAAGTQTEVARQTWAIPTATAASENGRIDWSVITGGVFAKELQLSGADLAPSTNDGLALGTASNQFSDLFLASGAVIDFANGNAVLTHSGSILTVSTGDLRVTSAGTNAASVATLSASQTLTNKTLATGTAFAGFSDIATIAAPANPAAGSIRLYADSGTGDLACLDSAGGNCLPSGGTPGGSDTQLQRNNAGAFGGISGATSNGTSVTFTSGNLLATSPQITTGINDSNGNELFLFTATGSAVNEFTVINAAASNPPALAATGGDTNIDIRLTPKGTGDVVPGAHNTYDLGTTSVRWASAFFSLNVTADGNLQVGTTANIRFNNRSRFTSPSDGTLRMANDAASSFTQLEWSTDLILRRAAAASLAFGAVDAASPVAQTLSVQNVAAGTTDTAGANWTHNASRGTGTGVGGDYIIQTAPAAAGTGTTQNALAAAFTVKGNGAVQVKSVTFTNLPTVANGYLIYCSDCTEANPCASGGSGALAKGINGVWRCD